MRIAAGLILIALVSGCTSCGSYGRGSCGAACGPCLCPECCCYNRKLDDWHTCLTARKCAALSLSGHECRDYRLGYTQAFVDVALGKTGAVPPVPPQRYWSVCFRSQCGHDRAADWYAGYRDGAAVAESQCGTTCRTIASPGGGWNGQHSHPGSIFDEGWPACSPDGGGPCGRYGGL